MPIMAHDISHREWLKRLCDEVQGAGVRSEGPGAGVVGKREMGLMQIVHAD